MLIDEIKRLQEPRHQEPQQTIFTLGQMRNLTNLNKIGIEDVFELFANAANDDGIISRKAVKACFKLLSRCRKGNSKEDMKNAELIGEQLFNLFDFYKSETVDFIDFATALSILCDGPRLKRIENTFDLYDCYGYGSITFDDCIRYLTSVYLVVYATDPQLNEKLGIGPEELAKVTTEQAFKDFNLDKHRMFEKQKFKAWFLKPEYY